MTIAKERSELKAIDKPVYRTGRYAMIEQFLADDINYMFGNPGTVEEGFLDILKDYYPEFKYIFALQETIALGAADGYARGTKKPTVVQLHTGVGLGNGIGMMYQAMRGHRPLVVLAGEAGMKYDAIDGQMAADLVGMANFVQTFAKPTPYEKFLANTVVLRGQHGVLGGLSGWLPATFRDDASFMPSLYRLLQSPLFAMSSPEALEWMEKCLCTEHEGFHTNLKHHQSLLTDFRRFFSRLDYLWPVNREMRVMATGGSIERALAINTKAFDRFSRSLTAEMK